MNHRFAPILLVALGVPALAGDGDTPPKPADKPETTAPAAPAPEAKKERKTTPEAEAAVAKYVGLLHFPTTKYKTLVMSSVADVAQLGGEVECKFTITNGGDVAIDITLPEAVRKQYGQQADSIKRTAASWIGGVFKPFIVPADSMMKQYDLASSLKDGKTVVEMTKFDEKAAWDKATAYFNADGLLERQVGMPNLDPNDPMAAMNAGAEIEMKITYKKRGDLYTVEEGVITEPMGDTTVKISYFEIEGVQPLPKNLEINSPMMPLTIEVFDYVLDGKPVAATARKKPEPPPAAPKKDEPVKPAEPPAPK